MFPTPYQNPEQSTWSPFDRLASLRDDMNRLFEGALPSFWRESRVFGGWSPAIDIYEDKDNLFVTVEVPGMKKEDIEISLHDGMLTISGERKKEETGKGTEGFESYHSERFFGRFHRSLTLPTLVDASKATASYKEGVLWITLPKAEEAKPKQIEVNVS